MNKKQRKSEKGLTVLDLIFMVSALIGLVAILTTWYTSWNTHFKNKADISEVIEQPQVEIKKVIW